MLNRENLTWPIFLEEKERKFKKKRPNTFKKYAVTFFRDSSVTGVSAIIRSKGCCRKFVKVLILVLGVLGFLFHTFEFLKLYWQYSIISQVSRMNTIEKPAITICDENLISRYYFCENLPDLCREYNDYVCYDLAAYCVEEDNVYKMVPDTKNNKVKYEDEYFGLTFIKDNGFQIDESLIKCKWTHTNRFRNKNHGLVNTNCSKPMFLRGMNKEKLPGGCYSFESTIGKENITNGPLKENAGLNLVLKWDNSDLNNIVPSTASFEIIPTDFRRTYFISVHAPGQLTNPFMKGFTVEERKAYKILVSQVDKIRLPPPYTSKCYDYISDWKKNGGFGPLGKEDCQKDCEIHENHLEYKCVPKDIDYPHEYPMCSERHHHNSELRERIKVCIENCKEACLEITYRSHSEVLGQISINESKATYGVPSVVSLEFQFDILNSAVLKDGPKYESVELFSYIGGYLGMWLGWSLVAIFDFFEIAFHIIKYPCTLRKKRRLKKMQVMPFVPDYYYY